MSVLDTWAPLCKLTVCVLWVQFENYDKKFFNQMNFEKYFTDYDPTILSSLTFSRKLTGHIRLRCIASLTTIKGKIQIKFTTDPPLMSYVLF